MLIYETIPAEIAALIPCGQLGFTAKNIRAFQGVIQRLEIALNSCPAIGETEQGEEHPAIFHYFHGSTNIFICEYDRKDLMFGYNILNGDLPISEWGYISLAEITSLPQCRLNYIFPEQTVEAALHTAYPNYFKKPQSLTA